MKPLLNTLICVVSIAILVFLYNKAQMIDIEQHHRLLETLQELKQLDATLTKEVLQSRHTLNNNYDNLAATTKMIEQSREHWLAFDIPSLYEQTSELAKTPKNAYLALLKEKTELVERFKNVNTVLSNSERDFPIAMTELASNSQALEKPANQLLTTVLKYRLI
jgi:hypothetical protein